ncbi:MAG: LysR family transcriptional regulator [Silvanigrellaceae bacterium]|nr:LysR family transcriptional regulator [Silvanigrellaceae bacterium]
MISSPSDLCYFIEVASTLNISRAAERAGISQPSLSLAMQRLEESIGTALLTRNKSGVTLTQAGKQLLAHSKHLLQIWDKVKDQALATVNEIQGSYSIGCHPSIALYSLGNFLPNLMEQHKQLNIKLIHALSRKIVEGVISSSIDIGIVVNPIHHPDLVIRKICEDEITFWSSNSARDIEKINSNDAILLCDPELLQVQSVLKKMSKIGIKFKRVIPSSSLEVIAMLTSSGCGVGILPSRVAALIKSKKLENFPSFQDEICLLFRVENKNVRTIQAISKAITASMSSFQTELNSIENLQN